MTAVAEARALLDQLMGGERNAPLPKGAALPRKRKDGGMDSGGALLLPGKRSKSCYDRDICPLYCAWGVDVYELFVNTKSDIGPNPNKPDDAARQEYLGLPQHERDRLGFEHLLFTKLAELVQSCDRTVRRNHDKLEKELQRQLQKRGGQDYVIDVDEAAVEQLCRNRILLERLMTELVAALDKLQEIKQKEDEALKATEAESKVKDEDGDTTVKQEDGASSDAAPVKQEESSDAAVKMEDDEEGKDSENPASAKPPSKSALELGAMLLEKQAVVVDIANLVSQVSPLEDQVEQDEKNLNYVKSDTTTDKTVCEVSGNFMSARDADERIAAHYAGKQYVGWKLVRDKFAQLLKQYGKYGPPPPGRGPPGGGGPPMHMAPPRGGGGGGGDRGGGDRWRGGNDRGGGRRDHRGGGGGGGRRDGGGRWERGGGGAGGGYDRGGYDRGRGGGGGGYDRGGYDRGGGGGRRGGGGDFNRGGNWRR